MMSATIAAVATPPGVGGIGVVRISGPDAKLVADRVFCAKSGRTIKDSKGYTALFGRVAFGGEIIDEAVALVFCAPKSYTGEDVVELSVHGGTAVVKKVLRAVLQAGAEAAAGGEFTKRAYLNGKLSLTDAELVINVINASGERALRQAMSARDGALYKRIDKVKIMLTRLAAEIGADADYPEEELEGIDLDNLSQRLETVERELSAMLTEYDTGRLVREGIDTAIVGRPNVGKSTLMNMLAGCDRSIVTPIAGTTRDVVEETVMLGDVMLRLSDTAGIHDTRDQIEKIGVERSRKKLDSAQLVLAVCDGSEPLKREDRELLELCRLKDAVIVVNKTDLMRAEYIDELMTYELPVVEISAATGEGMEELAAAIEKVTGISELAPDTAVLQNERQRAGIERALQKVTLAKSAMRDICGVLVAEAVEQLQGVTGEDVTALVADEIFKNFCVGK